MNILRVCIDNDIVFCGPATGFTCTGSYFYVRTDDSNEGFYRGNGRLTVEWLAGPSAGPSVVPLLIPEARTAVRYLIRTATIVPLDMYSADDAAVFQSLLPALADTVSDDAIDQVILDVLCAYRRS
jgi:hypothetical protein